MRKHVAVLMGGFSAEREVSLRSGEACAKALAAQDFDVTRVDVDRNVAAALAKLRPDVAFNALHGPYGEDGIIQGVLEMLQEFPTPTRGFSRPHLRCGRISPRTC